MCAMLYFSKKDMTLLFLTYNIKFQNNMVTKFLKTFLFKNLNYKMKTLISKEVSCVPTRQNTACTAAYQFSP